MAIGIKSVDTLEKGDILVANGYMDVFDFDSETNQYQKLDTAIQGDDLGFFYKRFPNTAGRDMLAFLPLDAQNADGSPAFGSREYYFILTQETYTYKTNPKYNYPNKVISQVAELIDKVVPQNNEISKSFYERYKRIIFAFGILLLSGISVILIRKKR